MDLRKVKVSPQLKVVLAQQMSNWDALHTTLTRSVETGEVSSEDVLKMIKVEATTKRRLLICTRLLAVYHRLLKAENERKLAALLAR